MMAGLILAGGRSSRFGQEKALVRLGGRSLIEAGLEVLKQGCVMAAISARMESGAARFAATEGLVVLPDPPGMPTGPLAGILAGLLWAGEAGAEFVATAPCDTPFLPMDLVGRLAAALSIDGSASVARTAEGLQPLCAIWPVSAVPILHAALSQDAHPPVKAVLAQLRAVEVQFDEAWRFANINTQAELDAAARRCPARAS